MVKASSTYRRQRLALAALLLAAWLGLCLVPTRAAAAPSSTVPSPAYVATPLFGNLYNYVFGNRSRVVQAAFIGFAIGIAILVTATRKH